MRPQPHQVIQNPGNLVKHDPDVLRAQRRLDTEQFFYRQHITMFVTHHRHVVQPIHVTNALIEWLALGELFSATMQ